MIKITLIAIGKLKENYLNDAAEEYIKRLSKYCDLNIVGLPAVSLPDSPSQSQIEAALEKEAAAVLKRIPDGAYTAAMCIEGEMLSSRELADSIGKLCSIGKSICFVIGSSYGLAPSVKKRADLRLSVSRMTFPHQLFRIMLLEQLYRAFKINEGGQYHK